MRRRRRHEMITVEIDPADYIDLDGLLNEEDVEALRENIWRGVRALRGPNPSVQDALIYMEKAFWDLNAKCPEKKAAA